MNRNHNTIGTCPRSLFKTKAKPKHAEVAKELVMGVLTKMNECSIQGVMEKDDESGRNVTVIVPCKGDEKKNSLTIITLDTDVVVSEGYEVVSKPTQQNGQNREEVVPVTLKKKSLTQIPRDGKSSSKGAGGNVRVGTRRKEMEDVRSYDDCTDEERSGII